MAVLLWSIIILIPLIIAFGLYACVVVGKRSKSEKEQYYEELEEMEYVRKCKEAKKLRKINSKGKYKDKKQKDVIYL